MANTILVAIARALSFRITAGPFGLLTSSRACHSRKTRQLRLPASPLFRIGTVEAVLTTCLAIGVAAGWYIHRRRKQDIRLLTEGPTLRLNGASTYQYQVIGVSRYQSALKRIHKTHADADQGRTVQAILVQEKGHKKHKGQIAVRVEVDGAVVGFLPGDLAAEYRVRLIDAGYPEATVACKARITAQRSAGLDDEFYYSARLDLPPKRPH